MAWYETHTHCLDQQKHGELSTSLEKCREKCESGGFTTIYKNFISFTEAFSVTPLRDSYTFINKNTNCIYIMLPASLRTIHLAIYIISKRFELRHKPLIPEGKQINNQIT